MKMAKTHNFKVLFYIVIYLASLARIGHSQVPYTGQPFPGQPFPGQPFPGQPYTYPGQPFSPFQPGIGAVARKQLIVTSFPGGQHFPYYKQELAKTGNDPSAIVNFLHDYARAATAIGDDFMIVYPVENEGWINPADFADTNALMLAVPNELAQDFWMRDFTTVGTRENVHFRYEPWYLGGEGSLAEVPFLNLISSILGPFIRMNTSPLALDGGNIVDCEDKAITTWRVAEENPTLLPQQIFDIIQQKLPGKRLCFLDNPPRDLDTTGHADGLVAFLDRNTLFVADYGDGGADAILQRLAECYPQPLYPFLRIIRLPSNQTPVPFGPVSSKSRKRREAVGHIKTVVSDPKKNDLTRTMKKAETDDLSSRGGAARSRKKRQVVDRFTSAVGATINMAMTYRGIYVPTFQSVNVPNANQVDLIRQYAGGKNVQTVDTGRLSAMGGSVRCLSWQMDADTPIARGLIARAVPARAAPATPFTYTGPYNPYTINPYNPFTNINPYSYVGPVNPYINPFSRFIPTINPYGIANPAGFVGREASPQGSTSNNAS